MYPGEQHRQFLNEKNNIKSLTNRRVQAYRRKRLSYVQWGVLLAEPEGWNYWPLAHRSCAFWSQRCWRSVPLSPPLLPESRNKGEDSERNLVVLSMHTIQHYANIHSFVSREQQSCHRNMTEKEILVRLDESHFNFIQTKITDNTEQIKVWQASQKEWKYLNLLLSICEKKT